LILLLRGLCGVLPGASLLESPRRGGGQVSVLADAWILFLDFLQRILHGLGGSGAGGGLNFARDLWGFGGHSLAERRTVELQQFLDLLGGVVLVVDGDQLFRNLSNFFS
jgi:hypothetical protein